MNPTIENLEKERKRELDERKERYEKDLEAAFKGENQDKVRMARFRKKKTKEEEKVDGIKEFALVNADALKEFIKYGSNKVLDQIRIRNQADVIAREEIEKIKKKDSIDMKQAGLTIAILAIFGVMVYVVVINFMDYSTVTKDLTAEKVKVGDVSGKLAACQSELAAYKPGAKPINTGTITPETGGGGNTIEG